MRCEESGNAEEVIIHVLAQKVAGFPGDPSAMGRVIGTFEWQRGCHFPGRAANTEVVAKAGGGFQCPGPNVIQPAGLEPGRVGILVKSRFVGQQ